MRGTITMLVILGALYLAATGTRRLFLADVMPIAAEEAPQSMWALDAAFLLRSLENIAILGFAIVLIAVVLQWIRKSRRYRNL